MLLLGEVFRYIKWHMTCIINVKYANACYSISYGSLWDVFHVRWAFFDAKWHHHCIVNLYWLRLIPKSLPIISCDKCDLAANLASIRHLLTGYQSTDRPSTWKFRITSLTYLWSSINFTQKFLEKTTLSSFLLAQHLFNILTAHPRWGF
jgi:hypothetical protein